LEVKILSAEHFVHSLSEVPLQAAQVKWQQSASDVVFPISGVIFIPLTNPGWTELAGT